VIAITIILKLNNMVKAYIYELEKISGGYDKVKFIVNSGTEQEAKNEIQSHYAANRKKDPIRYKNGLHNTNASKITEIPLDNEIMHDASVININL
jgi:hypothetical protein